MAGGDEQAHLPWRRPPKAVSMWQFEFVLETYPLPSALALGGEQWGGGSGL